MDKRQVEDNKELVVVIDNSTDARALLDSREFDSLRFFQGKKYLVATRISNANKGRFWYTYHYLTEEDIPEYPNTEVVYCRDDIDKFIENLYRLKPPIDKIARREKELKGLIKHFKSHLEDAEAKLEDLYKETPTK